MVHKRWNLFFDAVIKAVEKGVEFDEKAFGEELSEFEIAWTKQRNKFPNVAQKCTNKDYPILSNVESQRAAWVIYKKWMEN